MDLKDVANLTTMEKVVECYEAIIKRDNLEYMNTHSVFGRGATVGMEAIMLAITASMSEQKLLESDNKLSKKINTKKKKGTGS